MKKQEQIDFVTTVCNELKEDLLKKIDKVPEEWDGNELRQWIGEYYKTHWVYKPLKGKRLKEFINTWVTKNLI